MRPPVEPRVLPRLDHLVRLMRPAGIVQFCVGDTPDASSGTCLDDNARAWLVAIQALTADPGSDRARQIGDLALGFVARAQRADGAFHNMSDIKGVFTDEIGSQESIGRAMWACGVAARSAPVPEWRLAATTILERAVDAIDALTAVHARAYAVLGLAAAIAPEKASPLPVTAAPIPDALARRLEAALGRVADALVDEFHASTHGAWTWWGDRLTWGNARLPEALLRAALATEEPKYSETGMRGLAFLAGITQSDGMFVPIGNDGWYARGARRAIYDQQPIEACGMVDLWLAAHRLTGDESHVRNARVAFEWFTGANTENLSVAVPEIGGCFDGLQPGHVNQNMGAESTLSYLHAAFSLDTLRGS